ncbi:MAG: phenylalanine--tRNA ligase subunit beta [Chloroflexi bacterium]|nr:phenylalanine--tRNA ligase subunit beta [Chloroflexota bacterium]
MKLPLSWLKDYVNIALPPQDLAHRLTMAGTEVSGIVVVGGRWDNIFVGRVIALAPHPNADRLQLATVRLDGEEWTVVTGAPNLAVGARVPFARVGAWLIDGHTGELTPLKAARIRGVLSEGMVCSEKELGISEDHVGIMILPPDAPVGVPLAEYLGDVVLDLKVTPNRPDCLSVLGIAREVAALTGEKLRIPLVDYPQFLPPVSEWATVDIADPDLCPRYCATLVADVAIGPSPPWMQERLLACGMRPINNVVDVTNYVMLEYGQPLHAFDYHRLRDRKIIVRRARAGESLITLDGMERPLAPGMLVIADAQEPVALAGVMGGSGSEVTESTTHVLIESANFNHISIRRTCAALRLRTEASLRFDKGLSPELPLPALQRATQLMAEISGGKAAQGVIDVYPGKREATTLLFSLSQVQEFLGVPLSHSQVVSVLGSLGFSCSLPGEGVLQVEVPYWRQDVTLVEDVAEELARGIGYDSITATPLSGAIPPLLAEPLPPLRERVKDILAACGLQEVITYTLTSGEVLGWLSHAPHSALKVSNPMSAEQEYLRTSLRGGLLTTLASNERYQAEGIHIFEAGKVYLPREGDLPREREMVAGLLSGRRQERAWLSDPDPVDFYDAKGVLEALFQSLGVEASFQPATDPHLLPNATAQVLAEGAVVGLVGQVHPQVLEHFHIETRPVYLFELDLETILPHIPPARPYHAVSRFPPVTRDMALVVDDGVAGQRVMTILREEPLVAQVTLFDVYRGPQVPEGKKSLAFSLLYQSPDHTLTEEEVNRAQERLVQRLGRELGATLRR